MPSYFVQIGHVIAFLQSRGIRAHDPDNPFAFLLPNGNTLFAFDAESDLIDIGQIYEDWEKAGCGELADELVAWLEKRPVWY